MEPHVGLDFFHGRIPGSFMQRIHGKVFVHGFTKASIDVSWSPRLSVGVPMVNSGNLFRYLKSVGPRFCVSYQKKLHETFRGTVRDTPWVLSRRKRYIFVQFWNTA